MAALGPASDRMLYRRPLMIPVRCVVAMVLLSRARIWPASRSRAGAARAA